MRTSGLIGAPISMDEFRRAREAGKGSMTPLDRTDLIERDLQSHAKTITEFTTSIAELKKEVAIKGVRDELKDEYLEERLGKIEERLNGINRLGWWILAAFGGTFITVLANFIFKGGLVLVAK
ncbi:MAG: hypothetical protein BGO05_05555 [Rhizobiales bacterium 63-7]|nr:hypothetical protein [Hyphomicrobiales bacterium]OJU66666.1 MAG: hypothetical protein BGO05_05555 [Rhizobiales bacterium 63-7]